MGTLYECLNIIFVTAGRLKINEEFQKNRNVTDIGEIEEVSLTRNKGRYRYLIYIFNIHILLICVDILNKFIYRPVYMNVCVYWEGKLSRLNIAEWRIYICWSMQKHARLTRRFIEAGSHLNVVRLPLSREHSDTHRQRQRANKPQPAQHGGTRSTLRASKNPSFFAV